MSEQQILGQFRYVRDGESGKGDPRFKLDLMSGDVAIFDKGKVRAAKSGSDAGNPVLVVPLDGGELRQTLRRNIYGPGLPNVESFTLGTVILAVERADVQAASGGIAMDFASARARALATGDENVVAALFAAQMPELTPKQCLSAARKALKATG